MWKRRLRWRSALVDLLWLLLALFAVALLLILPLLPQGCVIQAPLRCRPNAAMVGRSALSATDYMYGIKCQEILK